MNTVCFACKEKKELTIEHIIPQALGGKLKEKLYCKDCNQNLGRTVDKELVIQFGKIATLLNIKRERGVSQHFGVEEVKNGKKLVFDGKSVRREDPKVELKYEAGKKILKYANIIARSEKELKKIIYSVQKKSTINGEIKVFTEEHNGPIDTKQEISIDNTLLRRAVTKIAYSFLCFKIPQNILLSSAFDEARSYMNYATGPDIACANFINTKFMTDYNRPLHKIHIALNRNDELVIGYVSIFGIYRFAIMLSDKFSSNLEWPDFDYTYDPVIQREVFVNDKFRAPPLNKGQILTPKQSRSFVQKELDRGLKVIESYVDNYQYLGGELS